MFSQQQYQLTISLFSSTTVDSLSVPSPSASKLCLAKPEANIEANIDRNYQINFIM